MKEHTMGIHPIIHTMRKKRRVNIAGYTLTSMSSYICDSTSIATIT